MKTALTLIAIQLIFSGCATLTQGTQQAVTFNSNPAGATVKIDGTPLGTTPLTVQLKKKQQQTLTFEKEGYKAYQAQMGTTLDGWFWGNILIGGLFGSTTDGVSGAMYKYEPDKYFITLDSDKNAFGTGASSTRSLYELIVLFGPAIRVELVAGKGEHLDSLLAVSDISYLKRSGVISELRRMADQHTDDYVLATNASRFLLRL